MPEPRSPERHSAPPIGALFVATITATGSIAISAAIPGAVEADAEFGLARGAGAAVVGTFASGYALGHIVVGLYADERSKRRILIGGLVGFMLASIVTGFATDPSALAWLRATQGFFASVCPIIGRSLVRQLGTNRQAAKRMSSASALFAWAPVAAPLAAAWIGAMFGWRSVYFALAAYAAVGLTWVLAAPKTILAGRPADGQTHQSRMQFIGETLGSAAARAGVLSGTFAFAGFFSFLAVASGLSVNWESEIITLPLAVAVVSAGYALGAAVSRFALRYCSGNTLLAGSLVAMFLTSILLCALALSGTAIPVIVFLSSVYALFAGMAMPNATVLAMTPSTQSAIFAVALLGMAKMICASAIAWLFLWWTDSASTYLGWVMSACALASLLALAPLKAESRATARYR